MALRAHIAGIPSESVEIRKAGMGAETPVVVGVVMIELLKSAAAGDGYAIWVLVFAVFTVMTIVLLVVAA